jgi:uncharacterized BrkB/YihY/UPF0761 family membrane protein
VKGLKRSALLNFVIDVAGYRVLGLTVARLIWAQASWTAFLIGVAIAAAMFGKSPKTMLIATGLNTLQ